MKNLFLGTLLMVMLDFSLKANVITCLNCRKMWRKVCEIKVVLTITGNKENGVEHEKDFM